MSGEFLPDDIPYFSYDRALTNASINTLLVEPGTQTWLETAAWIMREAAFRDVWHFLKPRDVAGYLEELLPHLGKHRDFWFYIIGAWRELGKFEGHDAA